MHGIKQVDQMGIGFDKHVVLEHNPRWYLYFLIYLKKKSFQSLTGQVTAQLQIVLLSSQPDNAVL